MLAGRAKTTSKDPPEAPTRPESPDATAAPATDAALLARISRGDDTALRALWGRCGGPALAVAQRLLGTRPEAEDVVQETFLQVWRQAAKFDPARGRPEAWVLTIARSRALDRLRTRGASERAARASAETADPLPALGPSPADSADAHQRRRRVQAALDSLPTDQRRTIELAYFDGLSQREIAERLGDPLGTVKTRVRLGLAKLAGALAELAPEAAS